MLSKRLSRYQSRLAPVIRLEPHRRPVRAPWPRWAVYAAIGAMCVGSFVLGVAVAGWWR